MDALLFEVEFEAGADGSFAVEGLPAGGEVEVELEL